MWKLFVSEFQYRYKFSIWYTAAIPFVLILLGYINDDYSFMLWLLPYLILQTIIPGYYKERRISCAVLLPVKLWQIALSRLLIIFLPIVVYYIIFALFEDLVFETDRTDHPALLMYSGMVIGFFGLYIALYDYIGFIHQGRRDPKTAMAGAISVLTILLAIIILAGLYGYSSQPPWLNSFVKSIMSYNPFRGPLAEIKIFLAGCLLPLISISTFMKRKSYLS